VNPRTARLTKDDIMTNLIAIAAPTPAESPAKAKRVSLYARTGARILLGLIFFVFGLNGLLQFLPPPPADAMPAGAAALTGAFMASGYLLPLVGATQALVGVLLLSNRFVPLALTILAPVVVNIVAFHAFLAPQGLPAAVVVLALEIYLAIVHGEAFRTVLAPRERH
jgi:uncharacterized membrane protein YphA (DoxX/SURF4 family)